MQPELQRCLAMIVLLAPVVLAQPTVEAKLLMLYQSGAEGSGAMPCATSISSHSPGAPATVVAQYLNEPIGVLAFDVADGPGSPRWAYYPESVDMDLTWEVASSHVPVSSGVDTVVLQYSSQLFSQEDANCTLWGVSTNSNATEFSPVWTVNIAHCEPMANPHDAWYGSQRSVLFAGSEIVVAQLTVGSTEFLFGFAAATGAQLYSTPLAGTSYGVSLSGDAHWALVVQDTTSSAGGATGGRTALVFNASSGKQRDANGCELSWNSPPDLSQDGGIIATPDQNGMWLCAWDETARAYGAPINVAMPGKGQQYWFPIQMAFLTIGSQHYAGGVYAGGDYSNIGRFCEYCTGASSCSAYHWCSYNCPFAHCRRRRCRRRPLGLAGERVARECSLF
jgi:hypothetical protein